MNDRYAFTNWTNEAFEGRFGGNPYVFAPHEIKEFDPDKHYMLVLLSKQLADRELARNIRGVFRNRQDEVTYGHAIGPDGKPYIITPHMRRELMRKAIGPLVDLPIPLPARAQETEEAGSTQDVTELKDQVRHLTEIVQTLTDKMAQDAEPPAVPPQPAGEVEPPLGAGDSEGESANMGMTRELLTEMATERELIVPENATKEELIALLNR